jgi:hypothetical protein
MRFMHAIASRAGRAYGPPVAATAVCVAVALAGCGSSSSSTTSSSSAAATTAATTTAASTPAATSSTSSQAGADGTTAPGSDLQFGAPATVDYKPGIKSNSPTYHLQVSVLGIEKGSQADMNGIELEKAQQGQTPYYVKLQIRNLGAGNASAEDGVPAVGFQATDDRSQPGQELSILGNFRPCESGTQPKQFTKGVTFDTCVIYMVGGGGSIVQEAWTGSGDAYAEKPIVWKAG